MGKSASPAAVSLESFGLLLPLWPDLHTLADEAEQNADKLPDFTTIRLRSFSEAMVCHLFRHHELPLNSEESQFEPPRVYRRVSGSMITRLFRRYSRQRRKPPLLRSV